MGGTSKGNVNSEGGQRDGNCSVGSITLEVITFKKKREKVGRKAINETNNDSI